MDFELVKWPLKAFRFYPELVGTLDCGGSNHLNDLGWTMRTNKKLHLQLSARSRSCSRPLKVAEKRIVNEFWKVVSPQSSKTKRKSFLFFWFRASFCFLVSWIWCCTHQMDLAWDMTFWDFQAYYHYFSWNLNKMWLFVSFKQLQFVQFWTKICFSYNLNENNSIFLKLQQFFTKLKKKPVNAQ